METVLKIKSRGRVRHGAYTSHTRASKVVNIQLIRICKLGLELIDREDPKAVKSFRKMLKQALSGAKTQLRNANKNVDIARTNYKNPDKKPKNTIRMGMFRVAYAEAKQEAGTAGKKGDSESTHK